MLLTITIVSERQSYSLSSSSLGTFVYMTHFIKQVIQPDLHHSKPKEAPKGYSMKSCHVQKLNKTEPSHLAVRLLWFYSNRDEVVNRVGEVGMCLGRQEKKKKAATFV